jgi:hypothetical protein
MKTTFAPRIHGVRLFCWNPGVGFAFSEPPLRNDRRQTANSTPSFLHFLRFYSSDASLAKWTIMRISLRRDQKLVLPALNTEASLATAPESTSCSLLKSISFSSDRLSANLGLLYASHGGAGRNPFLINRIDGIEVSMSPKTRHRFLTPRLQKSVGRTPTDESYVRLFHRSKISNSRSPPTSDRHSFWFGVSTNKSL